MEPNPQETPDLFKKVRRHYLPFIIWTYVGVVGLVIRVSTLERRLEAIGQRVLAIETIYDAEAITVDAHRSRPDDETRPPSEGE
jgi:hypothetical protein